MLNLANHNSLGCCNLSRYRSKMPGNGTDEMNFEMHVIILHYIAFEEIGKATVHDLADAIVTNIVE